jgi:hypothetical protein
MKYEFHTQLGLQECVNELNEAIASQPDPSLFFYKTLTGRVDTQGFSLRLARGWKDFYSPNFQGLFVDSTQGVSLRGEFKTASGVKVILGVWFFIWFLNLCILPLLLAVALAVVFANVGDSLQVQPQELSTALTGAGFYTCLSLLAGVVINAALVLFLRHNQKGHQERIINLLTRILDAQAQQVS